MEEIQVEKLIPAYDCECENCGQSPTVIGLDKSGKVVYTSGMCGPCTFGEAACIDPEEW